MQRYFGVSISTVLTATILYSCQGGDWYVFVYVTFDPFQGQVSTQEHRIWASLKNIMIDSHLFALLMCCYYFLKKTPTTTNIPLHVSIWRILNIRGNGLIRKVRNQYYDKDIVMKTFTKFCKKYQGDFEKKYISCDRIKEELFW